MGERPIESRRPWWKLYLLTWVVVLLVGGSLVVENGVGQNVVIQNKLTGFIMGGGVVFEVYLHHGWPFRFCNRKGEYLSDPYDKFLMSRWLFGLDELHGFQEFRFLPFIMDIFTALFILAATAFTTESYLRRQSKWQFSIQGIMVFTTFVALLLANTKYDFIRWRGNATWEYIPFFFIAVGLWCVFWTGWRLVAVGARTRPRSG